MTEWTPQIVFHAYEEQKIFTWIEQLWGAHFYDMCYGGPAAAAPFYTKANTVDTIFYWAWYLQNKLSRFKLKLETDREQIEMKSSDDIKQLKHQIAKLREVGLVLRFVVTWKLTVHSIIYQTESELENKLKEKEIKNQELERRCEKLLRDLETSQDQTVNSSHIDI